MLKSLIKKTDGTNLSNVLVSYNRHIGVGDCSKVLQSARVEHNKVSYGKVKIVMTEYMTKK